MPLRFTLRQMEYFVAVGECGSIALAAARVLQRHSDLGAERVVEEALRTAAEIDIYTNDKIRVEVLALGTRITPEAIQPGTLLPFTPPKG